MKTLYAIVFICLLVGCQENKVNYKKPADLIPKEEMINLIYDMHLAVAAANMKDINLEKRNYMSLVYEKYDVDSTRFANSNLYYTSRIQEYEEMFEEVERRLDTLTIFYTKKVDSIEANKTKEQEAKSKRDSIKQVNSSNPILRK